MSDYTIYVGDCLDGLRELPDGAARTCVTSPPYFGLRDYGHEGQIGLEPTPDEFVSALVSVFREVRRVLADDGTVWLNLGDSYAGSGRGAWDIDDEEKKRRGVKESYRPNKNPVVGRHTDKSVEKGAGADRVFGLKSKDLIGIPWRVALALQADGWYLRQDIIWHKPNPMPESVRDRCTKSHEYLFLLSKSPRYYFDAEAIAEPLAPTSIQRLGQTTLDQQEGSGRVPGKTNGNMKAVGPRFGGSKYGDDDRPESRTKSGNEWDGAGGMRNKRSVWTVTTKPFRGAHFAVFPPDLIEPCILAGSAPGDLVIDPFAGSGTTGMVAGNQGRKFYGCELNPEYAAMAEERIAAAYAQGRLFA